MFTVKSTVKTTLLCGPKELSKTFIFETAIYWAEEGHRIVYVTSVPLDSLPRTCHDKSNVIPSSFKLIKFMYLTNYDTFVKKLIELHTFESLPSVLLIDDLDNYLNDKGVKQEQKTHIARTCAVILDTMNTCSRILEMNVHICAWSSSVIAGDIRTIYFHNIWNVINQENGVLILLRKASFGIFDQNNLFFKYHKFKDGTRSLKQILYEFEK